jgi:hypothetical protein
MVEPTASEAIERFQSVFGGDPTFGVAAPGRVNLIGEHVDYCDGFVFPMVSTWMPCFVWCVLMLVFVCASGHLHACNSVYRLQMSKSRKITQFARLSIHAR